MSEPTLREKLEEVAADVYALRLHEAVLNAPVATEPEATWMHLTNRLVRLSKRIRALAARCEPEKPDEPAPLPAVLEQARVALEPFAEFVGESIPDNLSRTGQYTAGAFRRAYAALSAIEAYRPEPQSEAVREVVEELREAATESREWNRPVVCPPLERRTTDWAERLADLLESAVPEKREALPGAIPAAIATIRDFLLPNARALQKIAGAAKDQLCFELEGIAARLESAAAHAALDEGDSPRVRLARHLLPLRRGDETAEETLLRLIAAHADSGEGAEFDDLRSCIDVQVRRLCAIAEGFPDDKLIAPVTAGYIRSVCNGLAAAVQANIPPAIPTPGLWRHPDGSTVSVESAPPAPAPSAAERRCIACGETEGGSCATTASGKHVLETSGPEDDDDSEPDPCDPQAFVAAMEEAIRRIAGEAAREELSRWAADRRGDEPSLLTREDWRRFYAGLAMHAGILRDVVVDPLSYAEPTLALVEAIEAPLAPKPDPAPEERGGPEFPWPKTVED